MYLHSRVSCMSFSPCKQLLPWWYAPAVQLLCEQQGPQLLVYLPQVGVLKFILDLMLDLLQVILHPRDQLLIVFIDAASKERSAPFCLPPSFYLFLAGVCAGKDSLMLIWKAYGTTCLSLRLVSLARLSLSRCLLVCVCSMACHLFCLISSTL